MYGYDKLMAKLKRRRVREATLLLLAAVGGSFGALFGMVLFHHKTRHKKFYLGVPGIMIVQLVAAYFLLR